jgi:hypothetical protein
MENWKNVVGYEGRYQVSDLGNIKSMPKPRCSKVKILKNIPLKAGYLTVDLGNGQKIKRYLVHRLVATAFIENPLNKEQVNHIDGNKSNNNVCNLEWNTRSENQLHSIKTGLRSAKGEKNSQSKLTNDIVIEIYNNNSKYKVIANKYNVSKSLICGIKNNKLWTHITQKKILNDNLTL